MPDDLAVLALRFAAGELAPDQAAAFEARLAADPAAREALAEAVRLSARALGQQPPAPDPLTRSAIIERLRPAATVFARIFRRRPYRGHPLTWAGAGAGLAAGVLGVGIWLADGEAPSERRGLAPPAAGPVAPDPGEPRSMPPQPDVNRTVAKPDPAPPMAGGGGEAAAPPNPATTFLPHRLGPIDNLGPIPSG
jgi:anti-sigma factor RsiW